MMRHIVSALVSQLIRSRATHLLEDRGEESLVHASDPLLREDHLGAFPHAGVRADELGLERLNLSIQMQASVRRC